MPNIPFIWARRWLPWNTTEKISTNIGNDISMEMPSNKHLGNKNEQHLALAIKHDNNSTNNYVDKRIIGVGCV